MNYEIKLGSHDACVVVTQKSIPLPGSDRHTEAHRTRATKATTPSGASKSTQTTHAHLYRAEIKQICQDGH